MKRKIIIIIITIFFVILLSTTIFSVYKFNVLNPFSSCFGMIRILFTDEEYVEVQKNPNKVIFSKTADNSEKSGKEYLDEYMKNRGFYYIPEEQMGAKLVYSNGSTKESILYTTNGYYSKWVWD